MAGEDEGGAWLYDLFVIGAYWTNLSSESSGIIGEKKTEDDLPVSSLWRVS